MTDDVPIRLLNLPSEVIYKILQYLPRKELFSQLLILNKKIYPIILSVLNSKTLYITSEYGSWSGSDCSPNPAYFNNDYSIPIEKLIKYLKIGMRSIGQFNTIEICTTYEDSMMLFDQYYDSFLSQALKLDVHLNDGRACIFSGADLRHCLNPKMNNIKSLSIYSRARSFQFQGFPYESLEVLNIHTGRFSTPKLSLTNITIFKNLKHLNIQGGNKKLEGNYMDLSELVSLQQLSICNIELGQMRWLKFPDSLEELNLRDNRISSLSKTNIGDLSILQSLTIHQSTCKMDDVKLPMNLKSVSLKLLSYDGFESMNELQYLTIDFKYNQIEFKLNKNYPNLLKLQLFNFRNVVSLNTLYQLPSCLNFLNLDYQDVIEFDHLIIESSMFELPQSLRYLNIGSIRLKNISQLKLPPCLEYLEMFNFTDESFSIDYFQWPKSIKKIRLHTPEDVVLVDGNQKSYCQFINFPHQLEVLEIVNLDLSQYKSIRFESKLEEITLNQTNISNDFDMFQFTQPDLLRVINLDYNSITSLRGLEKLEWVTMDDPDSMMIDIQSNASNLSKLRISICHNKLTKLDLSLINDCHEILVNHNQISELYIPNPFKSLISLSLSNNNLTSLNDIPFDLFESLIVLGASNNPIRELNRFHVPKLTTFATMDINLKNELVVGNLLKVNSDMRIIWSDQTSFVWMGRK